MSAAERAPIEEAIEEVAERPHLELVAEPGRVAILWAELRSYLPTPANLAGPMAGVGAGSLVLLSKGWTWVWAEGLQDGAMRAGGVLLAGYAAVTTLDTMLGPYAGYDIPAVVIGWCVAAKLNEPSAEEIEAKAKARAAEAKAKADVVKKKAKAKADEAKKKVEARAAARKLKQGTPDDAEPDEDEPEYLDEDGTEPIDVEDVAELVRAVAARNGHQGAHLDDLLDQPLFEGWEKGELKAALRDDWELPVESFKLMFEGRQRVRDGVRLRHLPPAPAERVGEGPVRGLALVPSQPPASTQPGGPVSTLPGAPAGAVADRPDEPSPTAAQTRSQGPG
ncbi:hypothetical protein ACFXPY_45105 [Streptomyces sp. NPDC059153]|uniref:hypothetical protein n=1 Tax=Streptomyces sp. NPDC059153 TaxID=3346743 RepID=UPI0036B35DC9